MSNFKEYITESAASLLRNAIAAADGREVFFIGHTDENGIVSEIDVAARGTREAVAAVTSQANFGDVAIHNHPGDNLEPSEADVSIAATIASAGIASFIVNNAVTDIYVLVEPMKPAKLTPLDAHALAALLAEGGAMSAVLPGYEERVPQLEMLKEVVDAFNHDKISIVEAGTGTGKTVAYLIPAVSWAQTNNERVVISTHTINLQEQILHKDLPIVRKMFNEDFKAVLVKGRQNYVCLRRLNTIEEEPDFFDDDDSNELHQLMDWGFATKTGDRADLNFYPKQRVWEKIQSSGETCFRSHCPHSKECFVTQARRAAASAQILVTNHALLFSDIAMRAETGVYSDSAILPKYRRIILDEAHNIEGVATNHFGRQVSRSFYLRTLALLYRRGRARETGSLPMLGTLLLRSIGKIDPDVDPEQLFEKLEVIVKSGIPALQYKVTDCFEDIAKTLTEYCKDETGAIQFRLTPERRDLTEWARMSKRLLELMKETRKFVDGVLSVTREIDTLPLEDEKLVGALMDVNAHVGRLKAFADVIDDLCNTIDENFVCWLEASVEKTFIRVSATRAPLDISQVMISQVYEKFPTIIMTSATLTSRQRFDFLASRIGLNSYREHLAGSKDSPGQARPVNEMILLTPFDYQRQAIVAIPTDIDSSFIKATKKSEGNEHTLRDSIVSLLTITNGSAFVLFTSYGLMRKMAREVADELDELNMPLFVQGTENRDDLLKRFRNATHAVLFGTDSFWAGVDVVGDSLQSVIITKLPFRVPTEPIIEARTEFIEAHGGNSFLDYTVPLAVIKFRQGFGRLIRSKSDFGMVAILDRRVIQKYYGKWFLESLPDCTRAVGPIEEVLTQARDFLANHKNVEN